MFCCVEIHSAIVLQAVMLNQKEENNSYLLNEADSGERHKKWLALIRNATRCEHDSLESLLEQLAQSELSYLELQRTENQLRKLLIHCELEPQSPSNFQRQYELLMSLTCSYILQGKTVAADTIMEYANQISAKHPFVNVSEAIRNRLELIFRCKPTSIVAHRSAQEGLRSIG